MAGNCAVDQIKAIFEIFFLSDMDDNEGPGGLIKYYFTIHPETIYSKK